MPDIEQVERCTKMAMTNFRTHYPKSSKERTTLPRSRGGRGIANLSLVILKLVFDLKLYFLEIANVSLLHRAVVLADVGYTILNLKIHTG